MGYSEYAKWKKEDELAREKANLRKQENSLSELRFAGIVGAIMFAGSTLWGWGSYESNWFFAGMSIPIMLYSAVTLFKRKRQFISTSNNIRRLENNKENAPSK